MRTQIVNHSIKNSDYKIKSFRTDEESTERLEISKLKIRNDFQQNEDKVIHLKIKSLLNEQKSKNSNYSSQHSGSTNLSTSTLKPKRLQKQESIFYLQIEKFGSYLRKMSITALLINIFYFTGFLFSIIFFFTRSSFSQHYIKPFLIIGFLITSGFLYLSYNAIVLSNQDKIKLLSILWKIFLIVLIAFICLFVTSIILFISSGKISLITSIDYSEFFSGLQDLIILLEIIYIFLMISYIIPSLIFVRKLISFCSSIKQLEANFNYEEN